MSSPQDPGLEGVSRGIHRLNGDNMEGQDLPSVSEDNCNKSQYENNELEAILHSQAQTLENKINDIKRKGSKKVSQEPSAVRDPVNGPLLVSSTQIRKATLTYCPKNLKN